MKCIREKYLLKPAGQAMRPLLPAQRETSAGFTQKALAT
jgi:hypothetical protein